MFYFFSLIMGVMISVMLAFNGGLTAVYGIYSATIIIHIIGLILITAVVFIKKERFFTGRYSWFLYLGGAIGVITTIFTNFAFGRISLSAILALGLLGQSVTSIIIDQYGLLGMHKHPFTKSKLIGLSLILAGIVFMITNFEIAAVIVSFIAGCNIVISRTLNARLSDLTSVRISTFYNYLVGIAISILAFLLLGRGETGFAQFALSPNWHIYLGGALGVAVILLSNIVVIKISAFYLTLLIFVGQVFSGVLIDAILTQAVSSRNLIGGVMVAAGLSINLALDNKDFFAKASPPSL